MCLRGCFWKRPALNLRPEESRWPSQCGCVSSTLLRAQVEQKNKGRLNLFSACLWSWDIDLLLPPTLLPSDPAWNLLHHFPASRAFDLHRWLSCSLQTLDHGPSPPFTWASSLEVTSCYMYKISCCSCLSGEPWYREHLPHFSVVELLFFPLRVVFWESSPRAQPTNSDLRQYRWGGTAPSTGSWECEPLRHAARHVFQGP